MLNACSPFSPIYVAHNKYLLHSTWLQIPQDPTNPPFSILSHTETGKFYHSSVVGIINTDDLLVDPTQLCQGPELLATSRFQFSVSPPHFSLPEKLSNCSGFLQDYKEGLKNTNVLFESLCNERIINRINPGDGRFHFIHRRFLRIGHQHAALYYLHVSPLFCSTSFH